MSQITTKPGPKELFRQMGPELYREAFEKGRSLSAHLETLNPSSEYKDGLDAFGRVLAAAGIRTESVFEAGIQASTYGEMTSTPQGRALVPEWLFRVRRSVQSGKPFSTRGIYLSGDGAPGSWERPYAEAQRPRWDEMIEPAIPLSAVVAVTSSIDTDAYRAYYLSSNASQSGQVRVGEGAEVPTVKLTGGENTIRLFKYGRALEATYEQLRRQRLDKLALHLRRMAVQAEVDKLATAINTMVNGDGNSNAATSYNLTALDSDTTAGNLTLKGWLAFKMKFNNPYMMTAALAQEAAALDLLTLSIGTANIPLVNVESIAGFGGIEAINPELGRNVSLGYTGDAPANKVVAFDRRFALERVVEVGSQINEIERFTRTQTETLTITEVEGYAVIDQNATKILVLNA